jgi:hypothetical protein
MSAVSPIIQSRLKWNNWILTSSLPYRSTPDCWKQCNHDVTESIPAPWTHETNLNQWSFISKNCLYDVYLETMAKCLVVKCESSWDVQYAVEYGEGMCKKAVSSLRTLWSSLGPASCLDSLLILFLRSCCVYTV